MKIFSAYLFDLDGTLVDTAPDISPAFNHAMLNQGFAESSEALVRNWVGYGARVMITLAMEHYQLDEARNDNALIDQMFGDFRNYYSQHLADYSKPYPNVVETLIQLTQMGIPLGVVTNKAKEFALPLLDALELDRHFQVLVCGNTLTVNKPAAEPALHACKVLGTLPQDTLFVGDSETDVACAKAAGCPVACFQHGYNHGADVRELGADYVYEQFSQLIPGPDPTGA